MLSNRVRTKIEVASLLLIAALATTFIKVGQAGDTPRKDHSKIDCSFCHSPVADLTSDELPNLDLSRQCQTCHRPKTSGQSSELSFHLTSGKKCGDCHAFHETDQISASGQSFRFRFDKCSPQLAICASCHSQGENPAMLSDGHKRAAQLYHADFGKFAGVSPSQACMLCHTENGPTSDIAAGLNIPRFAEHGDHPLGVKVVPGSGEPGNRIRTSLDPRLHLVNGQIECQTCHSLSASNRAHLRDFASFTELCSGCHSVE